MGPPPRDPCCVDEGEGEGEANATVRIVFVGTEYIPE